MTRIQSVFNLLKRVGFALLLLGTSLAHAQDVLWQRDGELETSRFGSGLFPLGDQNDDGFADWAVYNSDVNSAASPWLTGLDFFNGGNPPSQEPYMRIRGFVSNTFMHWRDHDFGDFNGDGYTDWVVTFNPGEPAPADSMYFYFYAGGPSADTIPELIWGIDGFDFFVRTSYLNVIGDHNGDGKDDFYYYDPYPSDLVYIYFGNANWVFEVNLVNQGEPIDSGESVPSPGVFGDINGDGFYDYLTRGDGPLNFYFGSVNRDTVPDFEWNTSIGTPITMSIDFNSDGNDDIIKTIAGNDMAVFYGSENLSIVPNGTLDFPACEESNINSQASIGDVNRDGYEDLIVIQNLCSDPYGRFAVFVGGPYIRSSPVWVEYGSPNGLLLSIRRAAGFGDINADGIDDLAVASENGIDGSGRVVILSGDTTLNLPVERYLPVTQAFSVSVYPNPANGIITIALEGSPYYLDDLDIYNLLGQRVAEVTLPSGAASVGHDVSALATGIYLVHADFGIETITQKFIVLK